MTEHLKLPRKLSEERKSPPPRRPSHADVIENLDRWANSPGLQPPAFVRREAGLNFPKPAANGGARAQLNGATCSRTPGQRINRHEAAISCPKSHAHPLASRGSGR